MHPHSANDFSATASPVHEAAPRSLLQITWQRKSLVFLGGVIGILGGLLYAAQRPIVYQSTAQVLVLKRRADPLPLTGGDPRVAVVEDYVATQVAVIRSPLIIERAVERGKLRELSSLAQFGDPVPVIVGSLGAGRDPKETSPNIINLTYRGPVAEDCRVILDAVIESYKAFLEKTYQDVSLETLSLITKARDLLETDLKIKRREYSKFRDTIPALALSGPQEGPAPPRLGLGELETRRITLMMRAHELDERLNILENARKKGNIREVMLALSPGDLGLGGDPSALSSTDLETRLLSLSEQEQSLLQEFAEDHPQVVAVRRKIRMAREWAANARAAKPVEGPDPVESYLTRLRHERDSIQRTRQALAKMAEQEEKAARELRRFEDQDNEFRTEIAQTQALWDQTIKRLQEIKIIGDPGGYSVDKLSKPGSGALTGTSGLQVALAGLVIGLVFGVGLAHLADAADKSFRTPEEIRRRLCLPVFAHVPLFEQTAAPGGPNALELESSLVSYHRPSSPESEAYRGVRTALFFSTRGESQKVIQITSPNPGDGKSTVAANMAVAIAQSGKTVVLVDADLRRPRIGMLFGAPSGCPGLTSVLSGIVDLPAALRPSGIERLTLLTSGPLSAHLAELLAQSRFDQVLGELRSRFDFVIVDTPPVLAVTDPCVVAARADGVLLIVRLGTKDRPAAERAREMLLGVGAQLLGIVVNGVGRDSPGYGSGYYQPGYGYGYESPPNGTSHSLPALKSHNGTRDRKMRKNTSRLFPRWLG